LPRSQKDPHFAGSLQRALQTAAAAVEPRADDHEVLVYSWQSSFKPDAVLSLAHSAAIYDSVRRRRPLVLLALLLTAAS